MVESVLKECGYSTGVIGTINYRWNNREYPSSNTTPESQDLQKTLNDMRADGVEYVVMEISSHALQLNRADNIDLDVAVFTNLTGDHLDFHHSLEEYYQAKKRIFNLLENSVKSKKIGIVNIDDPYGARLFSKRRSYSYRW
jgi:UDP-N-acetylmuramyl tripeptide synthase